MGCEIWPLSDDLDSALAWVCPVFLQFGHFVDIGRDLWRFLKFRGRGSVPVRNGVQSSITPQIVVSLPGTPDHFTNRRIFRRGPQTTRGISSSVKQSAFVFLGFFYLHWRWHGGMFP